MHDGPSSAVDVYEMLVTCVEDVVKPYRLKTIVLGYFNGERKQWEKDMFASTAYSYCDPKKLFAS
jgi:hypothetical protein